MFLFYLNYLLKYLFLIEIIFDSGSKSLPNFWIIFKYNIEKFIIIS